MQSLRSYNILLFDVYGTLVDWETGLYNALLPLLQAYPASRSWTRSEALNAYSAVEADLETKHPDMPYADLLANAYCIFKSRLSEEANVPTDDEGAVAFAQSLRTWPIYPDTIPALRILTKYFSLAILSNVDHRSFAYTHSQLAQDEPNISLYTHQYSEGTLFHPKALPKSKSPFMLVITAQDVHAYKPAPQALQRAIQFISGDAAFQHMPEATEHSILMVAQSLHHDIRPASQLGLGTVWIDRSDAFIGGEGGQMPAAVDGRVACRFTTLGEFADAVEKVFAES